MASSDVSINGRIYQQSHEPGHQPKSPSTRQERGKGMLDTVEAVTVGM